jgi:hypothetical protein
MMMNKREETMPHMRWIYLTMLTALLLGLGGIALFAQAPTIGPLDAIGYDYADTDLVLYEVNRFETQYDGGAWVAIGLPVAFVANGVTTYKTVPPYTNGTHSVNVRACNAAGCGPASLPFAFAVLSVPGSPPTNLRKVPR